MRINPLTGEQILDDNEVFQQTYNPFGIKPLGTPASSQTESLSSVSNIANEPTPPNNFVNGQVGGYLESQNYKQGTRGWKLFPDGAAEFTDLTVTANIKTVSVGGNIQDAIDFLNTHGGGVVSLDEGTFNLTSDLILYSGVSLEGLGKGLTILDFGNTVHRVRVIGTSADTIKNVAIKDLTIQNSTDQALLDIDYSDNLFLENISVKNCSQIGIRIKQSVDFVLINCSAINNTGNGIEIIGTASRATQRFTLINCRSNTNGGYGFSIQPGTNDLFYGTFITCLSDFNSSSGFDFTSTGSSALVTSLMSCTAAGNGDKGYSTDSNCQQVRFVNCGVGVSNTSYDFYIQGFNNTLVNCDSDDMYVSNGSTIFGNSIATGATTDPKTKLVLAMNGTLGQSNFNLNGNTRTTRKVQTMQNASGGSLVQGNVVILNASSTGDQVITTTALGAVQVFGMADEGISNNNWGIILTEGYTQYLKVNGTTAISIGDFLSTYSVKGIAGKALSGHTAFAMALEAYSGADSNGVIDALIIPPRYIP